MRLSHIMATICLILASTRFPLASIEGTALGASLDLGEFLVSAEAESPLALVPAGSVVVIEAAEIERSGAKNLAEALEAAPGAAILSYGPRGAAANLSLRGASSGQILVILDGQRLNDARQGAPDLGLIPAESIERIEILKGGASAVYGPDALGGVVVITTKRAEDRRLALELSNFAYPTALSAGGIASLADGQRIVLGGSLPIGAGGLSFAAAGERAANAYPFGGASLRENAELLSGNARLGIELPFAGGLARASLAGAYQDAGVPGDFIFFLTPDSRQKDFSLRGSLGWSTDALVGGLLSVDLKGLGSFSRTDYYDPLFSDLHDMASGGADLRASALITNYLELGFGGSCMYEAANSTAFAARAEGQPTRFTMGGYLAPVFATGRIKLAPTIRLDWNDDYVAGISAMVGLVYKASDALEIRLSGGNSYRAPTFSDLFWPFTDYGWATYQGNPNLNPERGVNAEASITYRRDGLGVDVVVFSRYVRDLIDGSGSMPVNIGKALMPGSSLDLGYRLGHFKASASYEFLYPLNLTDAASLAEGLLMDSISLHQAKGSLALLFEDFEAELAARFWSERVSGSTALPAAAVLDLRGKLSLAQGLSLSLAAENLLDTDYQLVAGYPMPGLRIVSAFKLAL